MKEPQRFTKRPVTIEAIQWTGENLREVIGFTGKHPKFYDWFPSMEYYEAYVRKSGNVFKIITLEGDMEATPGYWIIKGVKGEFYPCEDSIFQMTYEREAA